VKSSRPPVPVAVSGTTLIQLAGPSAIQIAPIVKTSDGRVSTMTRSAADGPPVFATISFQ
jgi:hypothetical protein